jgi:hypothetical protein
VSWHQILYPCPIFDEVCILMQLWCSTLVCLQHQRHVRHAVIAIKLNSSSLTFLSVSRVAYLSGDAPHGKTPSLITVIGRQHSFPRDKYSSLFLLSANKKSLKRLPKINAINLFLLNLQMGKISYSTCI